MSGSVSRLTGWIGSHTLSKEIAESIFAACASLSAVFGAGCGIKAVPPPPLVGERR